MTDKLTDQRIDIKKLDTPAIDKLSSDIARGLAETAAGDPNEQFHLKLGHVKASFRNSVHRDIIIGEPETGQPSG